MKLRFKLTPPKYCAKCDYPDIRIGALKVFGRLHCNSEITGGWSIASWKWDDSITWSWFLHWDKPSRKDRFNKWIGYYKHNNGFHSHICIPFIGVFSFSTQRPMWKTV